MALISCPECGKQISDKAEYCIYCRFPLAYKNKPKGYQNNTMGYLKPDRDYIGGRNVSNESTNVGAAVAIIVILMIIGIAVYKLGYEPYYENKMADSLQSQDRVSQNAKLNNQENARNANNNLSEKDRISYILSRYGLSEQFDSRHGAETIEIFLTMTKTGTFRYSMAVTNNININQSSSLSATGHYETSGNLNSGVKVKLTGLTSDGHGFSLLGNLTKRNDGNGYDFSPIYSHQYGDLTSVRNPRLPFDVIYTSN